MANRHLRAERASQRPSWWETSMGRPKQADRASPVRTCATGPRAWTRPSFRSRAWPMAGESSSRWWVTVTVASRGRTVASRCIASIRSSREGRSRALNGSSSSNSDGSAISARAISTRARWPPEQTPNGRSASSLQSSSARSASARSRTAWSYLPHSGCTVPVAPVRTTVRAGASSGTFWALETSPIAARSSRTSTRPSRWPSTSTVPVVGCISAPISRSTVVLPAPLAPSSAQCSPAPTRQLTSSRITWPVVRRRTQTPSSAATVVVPRPSAVLVSMPVPPLPGGSPTDPGTIAASGNGVPWRPQGGPAGGPAAGERVAAVGRPGDLPPARRTVTGGARRRRCTLVP
ncbi:protein of unknown function [Streptantibioticus cattleyicolor NRRL 8057 = DSM 46488]|nr:protein of unknown function [Streptantibioticus cattleyicolor NRRL 8057 = DSM 46488]